MEKYRSGHNEAVLKTVCPKGRVGSNPTFSAKERVDENRTAHLSVQKGLNTSLQITEQFGKRYFFGLFFLLHFSQLKKINLCLFVSIDNLLTISEKSIEITRFLWYYMKVVKK